MLELLRAGVSLILQLILFFCGGSLLMNRLKMKRDGSLALLIGYLLYFSIFEVVVLPMILLWIPLRTFTILWMVLLTAVLLLAIVKLRGQWKEQIRGIRAIGKAHSAMLLLAVAAVLLQCLIVVFYRDTTMDSAYYVGLVSSSVYTGTLGRYNPYTGNILTKFNPRYVFNAYQMHNAVWCDLLGIHAIVQSKIVMAVINVIMANLVIYHTGKRLFRGSRKQADMMVFFVCLMQLFTDTIYTSGTFFFTRIFEGKAMMANISVTAVLFCSIWFWQNSKDRKMWPVLFLTSLSAVCFSGSSIILPVAMCAGILPALLKRREFKSLLPLALCMLPQAAYLFLYYGTRAGLFVLKAS